MSELRCSNRDHRHMQIYRSELIFGFNSVTNPLIRNSNYMNESNSRNNYLFYEQS